MSVSTRALYLVRCFLSLYLRPCLETSEWVCTVPWELFFADDLVIIAKSLEECIDRVKAWKEAMESKGLRVNRGKTKFMASGINLDVLRDSGKFPSAVCRTGMGQVSGILCTKCVHWVHKKCTGQKTVVKDPN